MSEYRIVIRIAPEHHSRISWLLTDLHDAIIGFIRSRRGPPR